MKSSQKKQKAPEHSGRFRFTDNQWENIRDCSGLSIEAKPRLEECVEIYIDYQCALKSVPPTHKIRHSLKALRDTVTKTHKLFLNMPWAQKTYLLETAEANNKVNALKKYETVVKYLAALELWISNSLIRCASDKKTTGHDSGNEDFIVECTDSILKGFLGRNLTRSKSNVALIGVITKASGYPMKREQIESSIRRLKSKKKDQQKKCG